MAYELLRVLVPKNKNEPLNAHYFECKARGWAICPADNNLDPQNVDDNQKIQELSYDPQVCSYSGNGGIMCPFFYKDGIKRLEKLKEVAKLFMDGWIEDVNDLERDTIHLLGLFDETRT